MPAHGLLFRPIGVCDRFVVDAVFPYGIFSPSSSRNRPQMT
jgi:hypothetical protein